MDFRDRLPRPRGGWASPLTFLQMPEDEYRALLKEHGYGDRYIDKELEQLRQARQRHGLPGPPEPKKEKPTGGGPFDRLAKRRKKRGDRIEKQQND